MTEAPGYDVWRSIEYRPAISELVPNALLKHLVGGQSVLEIGCGAGQVSLRIAAKGAQVLGVDLNMAAISQAQGSAASQDLSTVAAFEVRDVLKSPPEGAFDAVVLIRVLTCIPERRFWEAMLRLVSSKLRPEGLIYVHDFKMSPNSVTYRDRYDAGALMGWWKGTFPVTAPTGEVVFRAHHHSTREISQICSPYDTMLLIEHESLSMNGNPCQMFEFLGRKRQ